MRREAHEVELEVRHLLSDGRRDVLGGLHVAWYVTRTWMRVRVFATDADNLTRVYRWFRRMVQTAAGRQIPL